MTDLVGFLLKKINNIFFIEEGIITDKIAWLRTNRIRVIFSNK